MESETEVLIVGAGPTGLALALWLGHFGVKARIVDQAAEPGTTSRALAVHARILEFYDQVGLAREIVERGLKMGAANLWVAGQQKGRVVFGDMGQGISPFPCALIFPQDEHERLLIDHLRTLGVQVERPVKLVGFEERDGRAMARLRRRDGCCGSLHRRLRWHTLDRARRVECRIFGRHIFAHILRGGRRGERTRDESRVEYRARCATLAALGHSKAGS